MKKYKYKLTGRQGQPTIKGKCEAEDHFDVLYTISKKYPFYRSINYNTEVTLIEK